jgi:WD40 repeat protein
MIPDDASLTEDSLLADLLAADALLAAGRDPARRDVSETINTVELGGIADYISLLKRLGHRPPAEEPQPRQRAEVPLTLGRFEILSTLGQGGFGIVYLARDPRLGRQVALKIPRPEVLISAEVRRRFLREARAAAGLDHPNLVPVYEAGEEGPLCYIASPYCPGPSLASWLKGQAEPVRPDLAARLVAGLSDAVQHAHDRGILHRDIKPSNVILTPGQPSQARSSAGLASDQGLSPRLTDFGLAKLAEESGEETRSGVMIGSPPYMAPEQAMGKNRDIGPATDVYALGATLYEVLTGRPPFRGETSTETLRLVIESDHIAPRTLRPRLPRDLETICLKCLSKDSARRYATARALGEDLRRFLEHEPILARPITPIRRAGRWARRHPMLSSSLSLAVLMAAAAIVGLLYRNGLVQRHARELERQVARADAGERLARRHLDAFQLRQAQAALAEKEVERAQEILRGIPAEGTPDARSRAARGFAWNYLMAEARRNLSVLSDRRSERVNQVAISPAGDVLATGDDDSTIRLRDPGSGDVRRILRGHEYPIQWLAFSPDGRRLASIARPNVTPPLASEILLWDVDRGRSRAKLSCASDQVAGEVEFDARGDRLWVMSGRGGCEFLESWDVGTDPQHPRLAWSRHTDDAERSRSTDGPIVELEVSQDRFHLHDLLEAARLGWRGSIDRNQLAASSPDGRLLAIVASPWVVLWDVAADQERGRFESPRVSSLHAIRFSPEGRYLGMESSSGLIEIRDLRAATTLRITSDVVSPRAFSKFAFSPDGRLLARNPSMQGDPRPTEVWQLDPVRRIASYPGGSAYADWIFSRDGRSLIVSVNSRAIRWKYQGAAEAAQPEGHADEAWSLAFAPDGSMLASGSDDTDEPETIKLWDVASGRKVRGWNAGVGTVSALAYHPGGRLLASAHLGKPGQVRLWDPSTGGSLGALDGHADSVRTLAFSPDGKLLATAGSDRTVRLWDVATRRLLRGLEGHSDTVRQVAFSPDGRRLATTANDRTVRLWDLAAGETDSKFPWLQKIAGVCYSPDGRRLATADENGLVTIWDPSGSSREQTIDGDGRELRCLVFSPEGDALATAGGGHQIRLWDPVTAQELLALDGHRAQVNALAFSPDGSVLASCSHDGAVRLWRALRAAVAGSP